MPITGAKTGNIQNIQRSVWTVPETLDPEALLNDLGQSFALAQAPVRTPLQTSWFDTFDWRLYRRNLLLFHDETSWHLLCKDTGRICTQPVTGSSGGKIFPRDLSPGPVRKQLEPVLEMRCLLPVFAQDLIISEYHVKNDDAKTVAVIALREHRFSETLPLYRSVILEGVRGYTSPYKKIRRFFNHYGLRGEADPYAFFDAGAGSSGRSPLDYSSAFRLGLQPDMTSLAAMVAVYSQLLETMARNEFGILADHDSEFLHDFRVAIRRTRSGLGLVKNVLPEAVSADMKKKFAWLGKITGPTRDLDVYLLYEDNYRSRLPECLHEGLRPFFAEMRARRIVEQKKLVRHMRSKRYKAVLASWDACLTGEDLEGGSVAAFEPIIELSGRIILGRYKRVLKDGRAIDSSSPDEDLHRLRIQCKKLRYILEFFASLYPGGEITLVIKQLKRLQNNLGDFNDLSVQQDMLRQYLQTVRPGSRKNQEMAASLGGLLTNLYHEHRRVRKNFAKRFKEFSRPENGALYRELFGPGR